MSIQSLGVGSGIDLESLVSQLIEAERAPKALRLDAREEAITTEISSIGQVKSKLSEFEDVLEELRQDSFLNEREPTVRNPSDKVEPFTAEAQSNALQGSYKIAVTQLASGSRIQTANAADGGFATRNEALLTSGTGSLTFKVPDSDNPGTDKSFTVDIGAGMTLAEFREAVNDAEGNFGVTANIINTGSADGGFKLVFNSKVSGEGNDLKIVNDTDNAELQRLSTTNAAETATYLTPITVAQNAKATVDGIAVESQSNEFENTIQNVTFDASDLSELDTDGNPIASTLIIGFDEESLEEKVNEFVEKYNDMIDTLKNVTRFGASELEEDGPLAGDSTIRGLLNGLSNIVGSNVPGSALGGLFQMGIELTEDGKLEIGSTNFGVGSGKDRLKDALDDNFDDISKLFNADAGIATRLFEFIEQYTDNSGILESREDNAKDQQDLLNNEREQFDLRMISFEQTIRGRYINLDQTVARLNQTSLALLASL